MHDMAPRPRNGLSLCAGGGGLDMGLGLIEPDFHTRCYVEWEEYPRNVLTAAQQAGYVTPAPIWDDLTTFDARPIAGAIDTLLAGYPCQPFSAAGQRKGEDDPRHLFPHVARVARELGPSLNWIVLENVPGHVTLGLETVLRTLWDMGFTPAVGLFSASETGAPHERLRMFIVAHRAAQLDHTAGARCKPARIGADTDSQGGQCLSGYGRAELADASGEGRYAGRRGPCSNPEAAGHRQADTPCSPRPYLHPPGPSDKAAWSLVMAADPSRAPAIARCDAKAAAQYFASLFAAEQASSIERAQGQVEGADLLRTMAEQTPEMVDCAQAIPRFRRVADGLAHRSRALRLLGNGVHPLAAANALRALFDAHGLRPVDLEAASRDNGTGTDGVVLNG